MEIVKSQKFTTEEAAIVDRAVSSVFNAHNQPQSAYFPNVSLFISCDVNEHPDYIININSLVGDARTQMVELLRLSNYIFRGAYVEPRYLLASYEQPQIDTPITIPAVIVEPIATETIEEKAEELKHEVTDGEQEIAPHTEVSDTEQSSVETFAPISEGSVQTS